MQSPSVPTTTTYTTIPISGSNVIFRSFQNISSFLSVRRPWPEFISFERPESLSLAGTRLRFNFKYFGVNYRIIVTAFAGASLLGTPIALVVFASVFTLWLVLYFFREDPMVVWGHHVHDQVVIVALVLITGISIWVTGFISNLLIGTAVGFLVSALHGVFRNPHGLYLDETDAVSSGLLSPYTGDFSN